MRDGSTPPWPPGELSRARLISPSNGMRNGGAAAKLRQADEAYGGIGGERCLEQAGPPPSPLVRGWNWISPSATPGNVPLPPSATCLPATGQAPPAAGACEQSRPPAVKSAGRALASMRGGRSKREAGTPLLPSSPIPIPEGAAPSVAGGTVAAPAGRRWSGLGGGDGLRPTGAPRRIISAAAPTASSSAGERRSRDQSRRSDCSASACSSETLCTTSA
mmetsp:Transcript_13920/g.45594  ORF Transcript_13920/g.45594 Transcript_13920/m.45594 type:complete len:219 (-) Transcript_13920:644-1300(-)